jgi:hypothetical protein
MLWLKIRISLPDAYARLSNNLIANSASFARFFDSQAYSDFKVKVGYQVFHVSSSINRET